MNQASECTRFNWGDVFPSVTRVTSSCVLAAMTSTTHISRHWASSLVINLFDDSHAIPYCLTFLIREILDFIHSWKSYSGFGALKFSFFLELITSISWVTYARISYFITVKYMVITQHMGMHWQVFSWQSPQDLDQQIDHLNFTWCIPCLFLRLWNWAWIVLKMSTWCLDMNSYVGFIFLGSTVHIWVHAT